MTAVASSQADRDAVTELLGRRPRGEFEVVVRADDGRPVVIRNAPLLADGTPMPTRFWLVGDRERVACGRLEAAQGVRRAEAAVDADVLADAHTRYAAERDAALPEAYDGARPSGGVGGTASEPWAQARSARRRSYAGQFSGHRHGASGARSRLHLRTVSPFGYVRLSKCLHSVRIGMSPRIPSNLTRSGA